MHVSKRRGNDRESTTSERVYYKDGVKLKSALAQDDRWNVIWTSCLFYDSFLENLPDCSGSEFDVRHGVGRRGVDMKGENDQCHREWS